VDGLIFEAPLDRVRKNLSNFDFISYHPGWIPTQFDQVTDETFSFVNIDVDLYQPTLQSLEFFYPRLMEGGIINIDDYGLSNWPGCTRAVTQWREHNTPQLMMEIPGGGLLLVK
jgi:O-methyltransferase